MILIKHNPRKVSSEELLQKINDSGAFKGVLSSKKMAKTKIAIDGMCCSSEVPQVPPPLTRTEITSKPE